MSVAHYNIQGLPKIFSEKIQRKRKTDKEENKPQIVQHPRAAGIERCGDPKRGGEY
jgi:hypothetical protein